MAVPLTSNLPLLRTESRPNLLQSTYSVNARPFVDFLAGALTGTYNYGVDMPFRDTCVYVYRPHGRCCINLSSQIMIWVFVIQWTPVIGYWR